MRIVGIVFVEVGGDSFECLERRFISIPIYFVLLQAPPESLCEYIVHPSTFPVHTDSDFIFFQGSGEFLTRELRTLIRIEYLWLSMVEDRLMETLRAESCIHGCGEFPSEYFPRIPVYDRDEVHESVFQPDVSNVASPNMVLPFDPKPFQEIWVFLVLPVRDARILLGI